MFSVKFDTKRDISEGQYFVELISPRATNLTAANCDRLGYWCDKAHLEHFVIELLKCFNAFEMGELYGSAIGNIKDGKEK